EELKEFASKDTKYYFRLDRETNIKGDSQNELIYGSGGCNAHCEYIVYEMQDGCIKEIASFTAREYYIQSRCIYINNVDDGSDPSYEPWCFTEE
ncbi:MAG: hypothetical protein OEZ39_20580, partial [Gammaproteobacteria bacterium]|nr:hypothetical protein [Gammaproteobacteria bacterium]